MEQALANNSAWDTCMSQWARLRTLETLHPRARLRLPELQYVNCAQSEATDG